ncbi:MAG: hypothetical protein QM733_23720 [Ilumatobacteraceae bacterium]
MVTEEWLAHVERGLTGAHPLRRLPPLLLMLAQLDGDRLRSFEDDVRAVQRASPTGNRVAAFLSNGIEADLAAERQWLAGCAELALCASLLERFPGRVCIEPKLPNGKRCDAALRLADRTVVWIECTVLSISNDEYEAHDQYADVQLHTGDPYHDARRVYRKVFDKIVGTASDLRPQMHPQEPSVLVVVEGSVVTPGLSSLGVEWALEQILDPTKRNDASGASIVSWAERDYGNASDEALARTRELSALCLVGYRSGVATTKVNRGADEAHTLTSAQFAEVEEALASINRPWS